MPLQKGRALVLKIGDGGAPETFHALGAIRAVRLDIAQPPPEAASLRGGGFSRPRADAAVQVMDIAVEGLFHDSAADSLLFAAALARTETNFILCFPNGDSYAAAFAITAYSRSGESEGLEGFSAALRRAGAGALA